ncbi:UvrD-helicase domain-containing protein [Streptomyces sp. NPDC001982]|uniref:UvrD-helicase domain-containing protein n=1 Tax=Streptomyces sp. NPDC001982 TaxID=3154405 RepID=UPI0033259C26
MPLRGHPTQRTAVLHPGNVVLRAGPGSGTTRTLVARAAYLLEIQISAFRGVACITCTNAAADEIRCRVLQRGVRVDGRIICSTVHAFCLNEILRAFAPSPRNPHPKQDKFSATEPHKYSFSAASTTSALPSPSPSSTQPRTTGSAAPSPATNPSTPSTRAT